MSRNKDEGELNRDGIPELVKIVYGEGAELGRATAGERMRRWAEAFDAWLAAEAQRTSQKRSRDLHYAWIGFWDCCQKLPWEVTVADIRAWIGQLKAGRRSGDTIQKKLFALDSFYRYCDAHQATRVPARASTRPVRSGARGKRNWAAWII